MGTESATANRVERLRALMAERGYDAVVLRNNPDLRWLTGAAKTFDYEIAHTAFITADALMLHTDSRYYNTFCERLGPDTPWAIDQDPALAPEWAAARIREAGADTVALEDTATLGFFDELTSELGDASVELPRMKGDICDLRMVKDAEELELLDRAQQITDAAFEHICGFVRAGMTEMQVKLELENWMLSNGADGLSFDTIMATGANGANPHAQPGDAVIEPGHMIVMDYGALYREYHADMTRTVVVGEPTEEQQRVYDVVRAAHEKAAAAIRPGVSGCDIHAIAVDVIASAGYGDYFAHGLGHGVGLEIHERPVFNPRYDKPIPEGSIMTVEPGIYLPGRFGIRLEDCGVVTAEGYKPFTRSSHDLRVVG